MLPKRKGCYRQFSSYAITQLDQKGSISLLYFVVSGFDFLQLIPFFDCLGLVEMQELGGGEGVARTAQPMWDAARAHLAYNSTDEAVVAQILFYLVIGITTLFCGRGLLQRRAPAPAPEPGLRAPRRAPGRRPCGSGPWGR